MYKRSVDIYKNKWCLLGCRVLASGKAGWLLVEVDSGCSGKTKQWAGTTEI